LLSIGIAALAIEVPFFFLGMPSGHDVEFHLYSWLEVLSQWKHGILFPRWAAMAHFGYGEPRFIFYPPASWTAGALLSAILPWIVVSAVFIWLVLLAAGVSMFVLARRWLGRRDAMFAAVLYAVNPYHLVIVYWRSAFAELLASCLVPLLVLVVLKAIDDGWHALLPMSLVLAAAWLTNAPAAVMIHYSLALLLIFFAWKRRSGRPLMIGAAAVALGACLTAFYLLPAIYEQRWVTISEAVSAGSRPQDNFLFIHTTDHDHDAFNHIVSWLAVFEMVTVVAAAWAARVWRKANREFWAALLVWAIACSVLLFRFSEVIWRYLPKLEFMQFPWRWLLCLSMIFVLLVAAGMRRWWMRAAVCVVAISVLAVGWWRIQQPWWDQAADLREMQDNMTDHIGYEGTDEYTPVGADPSAVDKNAANVVAANPVDAKIRILQWSAETKLFTADMSKSDELSLRLLAYPAWRVEVNGHVMRTTERDGTGQIVVPVETGMNRVEVTFERTWDRTAGGWISVVSALGIMGWLFVCRTQNSGHRKTLRNTG